MTDATGPALAVVPPPVAAAPTLKSGWKTTEAYVTMLAMGGMTYVLEELLKIIPNIAQNPALPPWLAPLLTLAPMGIAYLLKLTAKNYTDRRTELKLGTSDTMYSEAEFQAALAAGIAQAKLPAGAQLEKLNQ